MRNPTSTTTILASLYWCILLSFWTSSFDLVIAGDVIDPSPTTTTAPSAAETCSTATPLVSSQEESEDTNIVYGTISSPSSSSSNDTSVSSSSHIPGCAFVSESESTIVRWYVVQGNGNVYTLSTCDEQTSVFTTLTVLEGGCMEDELELDADSETATIRSTMTCTRIMELSNRDCPYDDLFSSIVTWKTTVDRTYYVLVSADTAATEDDDDIEDTVDDDEEEEITTLFGLRLWETTSPINDMCEGAIYTYPNGITITGTTVAASNDVGEDVCAVFSDSRGLWYRFQAVVDAVIIVSTCNNRFTNYDTGISVFQALLENPTQRGTTNQQRCSSLECVGINDDGSSGCGSSSSFSWPAQGGNLYYILVQGFGVQSVGDFGLTITEIPDDDLMIPENDHCNGVVGPLLQPGDGMSTAIVDGIVLGATVDAIVVDLCAIVDHDNQFLLEPGVWYYVIGTGGTFQASTCRDDDSDDDDDDEMGTSPNTSTSISVLTSENNENNELCLGDGLTCVGGQSSEGDDDGPFCSTYSWITELNQIYYVIVHGIGVGTTTSPATISDGTFQLTIQDITTPPMNDLCSNAKIIELTDDGLSGGHVEMGTMLGATSDINICSTPPDVAVFGVWYSIVGTGEELQVTTSCMTDLRISIYTESMVSSSCDNLECVTESYLDDSCDALNGQAGNDGSLHIGQEVIWQSMSNQVYYILVHGPSSWPGEFQLTITPVREDRDDDDIMDGSYCGKAIGPLVTSNDMNMNETTVAGSTEMMDHAGTEGLSFCGIPRKSPGIWYYLDGTGTGVRVTTCDADMTNYNTALSVFVSDYLSEGDDKDSAVEEDNDAYCNVLTCIGGNDNDVKCSSNWQASTVAFETKVGQRYYILVHGGDSGSNMDIEYIVGNFALHISTFAVAHNNHCMTADGPVPIGGMPMISSTESGTMDVVNRVFHCGNFIGLGTPGVWYTLIGNGEVLTASTCSEFTEFNTAISVFERPTSAASRDDDDDVDAEETCSFDELLCVGGNDDAYGACSTVFGTSTYSWLAEHDKQYMILVHGGYFANLNELFGASYGLFSLTVRPSTATTTRRRSPSYSSTTAFKQRGGWWQQLPGKDDSK